MTLVARTVARQGTPAGLTANRVRRLRPEQTMSYRLMSGQCTRSAVVQLQALVCVLLHFVQCRAPSSVVTKLRPSWDGCKCPAVFLGQGLNPQTCIEPNS